MDPINRKISTPGFQGPAPTQGPAGPAKPADAGKKFDIGQGTPAASQSSAASTPVIRPNYDRLTSHIREGIAQSKTREQVLTDLVENETKQTFGPKASPEMTAAVTDAFKNDPHLSQIFNQLFNRATSKA